MASSKAWRNRYWRHSGAVIWRKVPSTILLAASESAVTKKPRLRLTIRRSSSVKPYGFFHSAISRDILISCGIQWFAQPARYFSHAHLYLNGTSWLTSVLPAFLSKSAPDARIPLKCPTDSSDSDLDSTSYYPQLQPVFFYPVLPATGTPRMLQNLHRPGAMRKLAAHCALKIQTTSQPR